MITSKYKTREELLSQLTREPEDLYREYYSFIRNPLYPLLNEDGRTYEDMVREDKIRKQQVRKRGPSPASKSKSFFISKNPLKGDG